jgi:hypothetical protein
MPKFNVDTKISIKGPVFQNPTAKIARFMLQAEKVVAEEGVNMVLNRLSQVLRNPTGYYESKIQTDLVNEHWEVNDTRRVLYGPWLEGTGSRNAITRFKGYRTFRIVKQDLDRKVPTLIRPVIRDMLMDLGGNG